MSTLRLEKLFNPAITTCGLGVVFENGKINATFET